MAGSMRDKKNTRRACLRRVLILFATLYLSTGGNWSSNSPELFAVINEEAHRLAALEVRFRADELPSSSSRYQAENGPSQNQPGCIDFETNKGNQAQ